MRTKKMKFPSIPRRKSPPPGPSATALQPNAAILGENAAVAVLPPRARRGVCPPTLFAHMSLLPFASILHTIVNRKRYMSGIHFSEMRKAFPECLPRCSADTISSNRSRDSVQPSFVDTTIDVFAAMDIHFIRPSEHATSLSRQFLVLKKVNFDR